MSNALSTASQRCSLRVLFVSDVYELDNWPRFLTAINELSEGHTIVCVPGDFLAPSLLASLDKSRGMIDCMNRCDVQFVCFGNHETDIPHQELINRIKESMFKWINSNMTDIDLQGIKLPEYDIISINAGGQTRKVGLIGLLTEDPGLYMPGAFNEATITPVVKEAEKLHIYLCQEQGVDLVLPMTHQVISLDRKFAEHFKGKGIDNQNAFPLVVAAHDHEPYQEEVCGAKIVKTGSDAKNVGICDIVWPDPHSKHVEVTTEIQPITNFAPDAELQKVVEGHQSVLKELDEAPLFRCAGELSSKDIRVQQTSLGTKVLSALRDALGSDCCVLNSGHIRGNRVYEADKKVFTYADLKTEIPFDNEMVVVMPLPGKVLAEAVKFSRAKSFLDPPESFGGFMQISDDMTFDNETQTLTHIGGTPINPDKTYSVGILFVVLAGVDNITPLVEWAAENAHLMPIDGCAEIGSPAKLLLVDYFSKAIWYEMGTFKDLDQGSKGYISREDVVKAAENHFGLQLAKVAVDNIMDAADMSKDGRVSKDEFVRVHIMNAGARTAMDLNHDGLVSRGEMEMFAKKIVGEDFSMQILDKNFNELDTAKTEYLDLRAVQRWLGRNFQLTNRM